MNSGALALGALGLALALVGSPETPRGRRSGRAWARRAGAGDRGDFRVGPGASAAERADTARRTGSGRWHGDPRRLAAAALGVATALVIGGVAGVVAGVASAVVADRGLRRLEPAADRRRRQKRAAELPLILDLLAVCLQSGMPLVAALETVAQALPGPFRADLEMVAGLQRLGSPAGAAWSDYTNDPDLAVVARAVGRSAESGSRLAAAFERLATERRMALTAEGEACARRAGVIAMAPLGLCFLPAFVSLGIVPIVLSLAEEVLS